MRTWRFGAIAVGLAMTVACSGKPNYGDLCANDGDCQGGLTCEKEPVCSAGADAGPGECTHLCTAATIGNDCPDAVSEKDRLLAVCQSRGFNCDGSTRTYCELAHY